MISNTNIVLLFSLFISLFALTKHFVASCDDMITIYKNGDKVNNKRNYIKKQRCAKLIFVHIPKNGGSYVRTMLPGENNDIHGLWGETDHATIGHIIENYPKVYKTHRFFAVVRNPWDRMVSNYEFCRKASNTKIKQDDGAKVFKRNNIKTFEDYVNLLYKHKTDLKKFNIIHWIPQHEYVMHQGDIKVNHVLKLETLTEDLPELFKKYGVKSKVHDKQINKTDHKHYTTYYTPELIKKVKEIYAKDVSLFNYEF